MTFITPTLLQHNQNGTDVTSLLATPASTTLTFYNDRKEYLLITNGATSATLTLDVGSTVLGQSVTPFTPVTVAANSAGMIFGPFDVQLNDANGNVTVVFSNTTTVKAVLLQTP